MNCGDQAGVEYVSVRERTCCVVECVGGVVGYGVAHVSNQCVEGMIRKVLELSMWRL